MGSLDGKRVLIGGGGGGIVSHFCRYLAKEGAKVMVNDVGYIQDPEKGGDYDLTSRSKEVADEVVKSITDEGGIAVADYENLSDFNAAKRTVEHCVNEFGGIDILINGTCISQLNECVYSTFEQWDNVIKNNLYPVYNLTKNVLPYMIEQKWGRLIYTNSAAMRSFWGSVNFAAAEGGVYSFMRTIANEVRPDNITANCIEPSSIGKTAVRPHGNEFIERRARALGIQLESNENLKKEPNRPEALPPFVAYLCSEAASNITGQFFVIRNGRYGIYDAIREKCFIYKDQSMGDWTVDELCKVMPNTLERNMAPLWFPRNIEKSK